MQVLVGILFFHFLCMFFGKKITDCSYMNSYYLVWFIVNGTFGFWCMF